MLHPESKEPLDQRSRDKLIENSICYDSIGSRNGYVASDQVEFLGDDIIEDPFEDTYGKFSLEQHVIIDRWKKESNPLSSEFQLGEHEELKE